MGKGSSGNNTQAATQSSALADEMARISRDYYGQTQPARSNILNRGNQFLGVGQGGQPQTIQLPNGQNAKQRSQLINGITQQMQQQNTQATTGQPSTGSVMIPSGQGGTQTGGNPFQVDPSASPLYAPGKFAAEQQFGTARDNIMSSMPEGGGLYDALAQTDISKAGALSGLEANISQDFFDKIYGAAFGAPQTAVSGLGGAGGIMGNLAGQQAQANAAQSAGKSGMLGGFGQGVGTWLGGKQ